MQTYGVALFYSTREAMKAEEIAKEANLPFESFPHRKRFMLVAAFL